MRILELDLLAFGPFTDRRITLSDPTGPPGLTVVYGPNEAGKSSALRAIHDLLYGIPERTPDNFTHRGTDMRLGASLLFDDGERLEVVRRKARKNSLRDARDQEAMTAERLHALTRAVPETLFEHFYGLDHQRLVEGSHALLADEGEVGRALFGAGLGGANLRSVLDALQSEAAELFTARGSKPRINLAIKEWKDIQAEIKQSSLRHQEYAERERELEKAEQTLAALDEEISEAHSELLRLQRSKRALSPLSRRSRSLAKLSSMEDVRSLRSDFEKRLAELRAERQNSTLRSERARAKIEREAAKLEALDLAPMVVAEREPIESLHQRVEEIREMRDQLPRRETELAGLDAEIDAQLASIGAPPGPDLLRALRVVLELSARIKSLASEFGKLEARLEATTLESGEARAEWQRWEDEREGLPVAVDPGPLQSVVESVIRAGDMDQRIAAQSGQLARLNEQCEGTARSLGLDLSEGSEAADLEAIAFPSEEEIEDFARRFAGLENRRSRLADALSNLRDERRQVAEALALSGGGGSAPTAEDLAAQRVTRDAVWQQIRDEAIDAVTPAGQDRRRALAGELEGRVQEVDGLADRLWGDAERIARESALRANLERIDGELADRGDALAALEKETQGIATEWSDAWRGTTVEPRSVSERRSWRRRLDGLFGLRAQWREARADLAREVALRDAARSRLDEALASLDASGAGPDPDQGLEDRLSLAQRLLAGFAAQEQRRRRVEDQSEQSRLRWNHAERQAQAAREAFDRWQRDWRAALGSIELGEGTTPAEALEHLDRVRALLDRLRERDQLSHRSEQMRARIDSFEATAAALVARCAPDLATFEPEAAAVRLHRLLADAIGRQALSETGEESLVEAREELEDAEAELRRVEIGLAELCDEAGGVDEEDLDAAWQAWQSVEALRRDLANAEDELERAAEGRSLDELAAQCSGLDPDTLSAEIDRLEKAQALRIEEQKRWIADLPSKRHAFEAMDGGGRTAELAESAQAVLARLKRDAGRYVELSLARQILEREIDAYRQGNQAPLLARTGALFSGLTRGAYPKVQSDVTEGRGAHLLAVHRDGQEVPIEGLSAGTRDQLFLALRLATLEERLAKGESMPLIADDILIEFDDERSRATLDVLADLGRKTQIILFSHHRHVSEFASKIESGATVVEL